jgi:GTPase
VPATAATARDLPARGARAARRPRWRRRRPRRLRLPAVDAGQTTLRDFRYKHHFKATPGGRGERAQAPRQGRRRPRPRRPARHGVFDDDATGELIADLVATGQEVMIARGGRGGLGNTHFADVDPPGSEHAQKGEPGEERWLRLELRLIADVGLVGLPNAGKSTLLAALTAATPEDRGPTRSRRSSPTSA